MILSKPIRIVIADDHEIFRDGFAELLNKHEDVILEGQASNGRELIAIAEKYMPDVILTDIKMPVMDGIEATKYLTKHLPDIHIIALSMFNDDNYVLDMMEAGARGYLLKNAHKTEIIDAIKTVRNNEFFYCKETSAKLTSLLANSYYDDKKQMTAVEFNFKERDIIRLIFKEFSNKEIAAELFMNVRTVEGYRKRIHEKMRVKNSVGIIIYALRHKLIEI